MFNHSRDQNVGWIRDVDRRIITYRALIDIQAGEELCKPRRASCLHLIEGLNVDVYLGISYGDRLTFVDADAHAHHEEEQEDGEAILSSIQV